MNTQRSSQLFAGLLLVICLSSFSLGQEPSRSAPDRLLEVKVNSPALKGNLLRDPVDQPVVIYLPPGYYTSPSKRYPTVYLLHGFGGDSTAWTRERPRGFHIVSLLDSLINDGKLREMIVVAPSARNAYGGSFYANSPVTGNWEDYIYRDLVAYVDANYRTLARPSSRGIAGHSMGGYGAVVMGMKHPDVFSAIYALSPCCLALQDDLGAENPVWSRVLRLTSREQVPKQPRSIEDFFTVVFVAQSAVFSPNPGREPFHADMPFLERDGQIQRNEPAYTRWQSKMPLNMVEEHKQNLLRLRGIFLDYGQNEQFSHIRTATSLFSRALAERQIPHTFEVYEGGNHTNKVRERLETHVFRFFSERLEFSNP